MHKLYKFACEELMDLEDKAGSGELSAAELEYACKLTEFKKNILKIEMLEGNLESGYSSYGASSRSSYRGGSNDMGNRGGIGNLDGESLYEGRSSARGRRYARRDSMGRYSRNNSGYSGGYSSRDSGGYSSAEGDLDSMVQEMRELIKELPQEKQQEAQKFIQKIESMG